MKWRNSDFTSKNTVIEGQTSAPYSATPYDYQEVEKKRLEIESRSIKCQTCHDAKFLRTGLPYGHPDFGKAVPCPDCNSGTNEKRLKKLQAASQLKGELLETTFDSLIIKVGENDKPINAAKEMVSNKKGLMMLWGKPGAGKTAILASTVNQAIANGVPAIYYTLPDLLEVLRQGFSDDDGAGDFFTRLQTLKSIQVLAIDEVDKANMTGWVREKLFQLINERHSRMGEVATFLASNQSPLEFEDYLTSRLMKDERVTSMELIATIDKRSIISKIKGRSGGKSRGVK
jgi:DNA replication protein DnaC